MSDTRVIPAQPNQLTARGSIARVVAPRALLMWGFLAPCASADEPAHPPAVTVAQGPAVTLEIVGRVPDLRILRRAQVLVRITNTTDRTIPDVSPEEYARGKPALYLGAWFAADRPSTLGTFEVTRRLRSPLSPGASVDVLMDIRPGVPGQRFLALGLLRASGATADYGEVGRTIAVPVNVRLGAWHENRRVLFLKGIALLHLGAFLAALAALVVRNLRS